MAVINKSGQEPLNTDADFSIRKFKIVNRITGWLIFVIASATYLLTIEPTASFWDCGEFITSSYKLEVGHPPGAPFFNLIARFFTFFAADVKHVAIMVNSMSALASGFTILFLFWSITHIARNLIGSKESLENGNLIAIMASGIVGALAYTFSDTFWFSAVEGEVYAMSSLFTALVFWAILKWENVADDKYANRWLILIAYLMGVSIGVHLLNLLVIPAIVFVYYFKKYEPSKKGILLAALAAIVILGSVMYVIIPQAVNLAAKFELLFVNGFGLPYNSGTFFYLVLLFGLLAYGIYYSIIKSKVLMNTVLTMVTVILIGYSSFALIIIRSSANPPMNQNQPDNVFSLLSYLNRDQYGSRPLVYGQYFNAPITEYTQEESIYLPEKGRYELVDHKMDYEFDSKYKTIFPRMYSNSTSPNHPQGYMEWTGIKDDKKIPSFGQNLEFFFKYQVNFMYMRYFMWNFVGRQNDIQGDGNIIDGNWISGIPIIDNWRLGPQAKLPSELKNNKGRNKYYFLPLLLGLLGIFYMYNKGRNGKQSFWVVMLFFIFTGLAIVVYLNQPPYQPRERDYAYAGSFYAFSIWIGFGVLLIYDFLKKYITPIGGATFAGVLSIFAVPVIMANENWDDHDRSNRYTVIDFASNYLNSCKPNAILFTNGDNDTFPLWYAQEVEGIRTDVRVINLSYLSTYWYVDEHKRQAYNAAPTPFSLTYDQYKPGKRDFLFVQERTKDAAELKEVIDFVGSDDKRAKIQTQDGEFENFIPVTKLYLNVDSASMVTKGIVEPKDAHLIVPKLEWSISGSYIYKNQLMVLDLLATNKWERPIYFAVTVGGEGYYNLQDYFQLEGLAYRLVPIQSKTQPYELGHINTDILYDNMMNKFKWGGINNPKVYLDENNLRMLSNVKNNFTRLAMQLLDEGKKDSAIAVLDRCTLMMPEKQIPYNYFNIFMAEAYYKAGETKKANTMLRTLANKTLEQLEYFITLPTEFASKVGDERDHNLAVAQEIMKALEANKQDALLNELNVKFQRVLSKK